MRTTALIAGIASVVIAGASAAGTPAATLPLTVDTRMAPIAATFPPLSDDQIRQRCHGFFRAISVRLNLAQAMGQKGLDPFDFVSEIPTQRLAPAADADTPDFMTPYMVAFGPLNPFKTSRSGLFHADRKTCTDVVDALG